MTQKENLYWLGFSLFPGIGPKRFFLLLKYFRKAEKIWSCSKNKLLKLGLPPKLVEKFIDFRERTNLQNEELKLQKNSVEFLPFKSKHYPKLLKEIDDPPIGLFIKGELITQDTRAIAVVGTRKITPYGRQVTEKFVSELTVAGFTIVSGLARGVDSVAHRVALGNGGRTIAVLGCGLDRIYPPEHKPLAEQIIKNNQGAIISEFPLGTQAMPGNFPSRNRIISGLSLGVLVAEGASKSGTKITARLAADQNREVFAIPGPITSVLSEGPAELIKTGAKLVTNINDILEEFNLPRVGNNLADNQNPKQIDFENKTEEKIWQLLVNGNRHIDEIINESGEAGQSISSTLTLMEITGLVKNLGEGIYGLCA